MDVVNPANMQSILTDTTHPFVPSINIPGYNIEKIDTTLSANLTFPDTDYSGNDQHTNPLTPTNMTLYHFSSI